VPPPLAGRTDELIDLSQDALMAYEVTGLDEIRQMSRRRARVGLP